MNTHEEIVDAEVHMEGKDCMCSACRQPMPTPNASKPIWDLVLIDIQKRDKVGRDRYGTPLQAHNGRDALRDCYEEALDLVVYLRQVIDERDHPKKPAADTRNKLIRQLRDGVKATVQYHRQALATQTGEEDRECRCPICKSYRESEAYAG